MPSYRFHPYALLALIPLIISGGLALIAWRAGRHTGARLFAAFAACVAVWSFCYGMEMLATGVSEKLLWSKLAYLGIGPTTPLWLLFALQYRGASVSRRQASFLLLPALVSVVGAATNDWHHAWWSALSVAETQAGFYTLEVVHGWLFWACAIIAYGYVSIAAAVYMGELTRAHQLFRRQAALLLSASVIALAGNLLFLLTPTGFLLPINFNLLTATLGCGLLALATFRYHLLDIAPIAHQAILQGMTDGIIVVDRELRIVELNPAGRTLAGIGDMRVLGRPLQEVASASGVTAALKDALKNPCVLPATVEVHAPSDREESATLRLTIWQLCNEAGTVLGTVAVVRDVTEQTRTELMLRSLNHDNTRLFELQRHQLAALTRLTEAARLVSSSLQKDIVLREILEQLRAVVPHDSAAILLLEGENLAVVAARPHGQMPEEPRRMLHAMGPTLSASVLRTSHPLIVDDVRQDPRWEAIPGTEHVRGWLGVPLIMGGRTAGVLCLDSVRPGAFTPADAEIAAGFAQHAAVALENASLFSELAELKEFNETVIQTMGDGVVIEDTQGFIRYANPRAREMLGYPDDGLIGLHYRVLIAGRDIAVADAETAKRPAGISGHYQATLLTRAGAELPVLVTATPFYRKGNFEGVVLIFTDISARVELEENQREMLAMASHDLRQPVQLIQGYTELILEDADAIPPGTRALLGTVNKQAQYLRCLTEDLLDLSRIDAGEMILPMERVDLAELLAAAIRRHGPAAAAKEISLKLSLVEKALVVWANGTATERIVDNLVGNAIKYTPPGGRVEVSACRGDKAAQVGIADTGTGIPAEELDRVFQRFYRLPGPGGQSGAGLGLAIAKELVTAQGGRISATSDGAVGHGTVFTFTLPLAPSLGDEPALPHTSTLASPSGRPEGAG